MAFLFKKKRVSHVHHLTEKERRQRAYDKAMAGIQAGLDMHGSGDEKGSTTQLVQSSRTFFAEFLPIHYQFTFEDLRNEVGKKHLPQEIKEKVDAFSTDLTEAEYNPKGIPSERLEDLFRTFGEIARGMQAELVEPKPRKGHHVESIPEKVAHVVEDVLSHEKADIDRIRLLLSVADEQVRKNDLMGARDSYTTIAHVFDGLSEESKGQLHQPIMTFYNKLMKLH